MLKMSASYMQTHAQSLVPLVNCISVTCCLTAEHTIPVHQSLFQGMSGIAV